MSSLPYLIFVITTRVSYWCLLISLLGWVMLGKIEGRWRRGWQRMKWLDSIMDSTDMNFSKPREIVKGRGAWRAAVHEVSESDTT